MITCAADLLNNMGWSEVKKTSPKKQRELFIELTKEEKIIVDILQQQEGSNIDELYFKSALSSSAVASALLTLEMQGVVVALPGKMYKMI